jgi:hypothetical protein
MPAASLQKFHRTTLQRMADAVNGDRILEDVAAIVSTDRWNSFNRFHETTRTLVERYEQAGARTEVHAAQTGVAVDTGRWIIQEGWDVLRATADIVDPIRETLLDYSRNPWHIVQWSGGTPAEGLTCEVVIVDSHAELDAIGPGRLTGKILLTRMTPRGLLRRIEATGAVGVITDMPQAHLPDATPWIKFGWGQIPRSEDPS